MRQSLLSNQSASASAVRAGSGMVEPSLPSSQHPHRHLFHLHNYNSGTGSLRPVSPRTSDTR